MMTNAFTSRHRAIGGPLFKKNIAYASVADVIGRRNPHFVRLKLRGRLYSKTGKCQQQMKKIIPCVLSLNYTETLEGDSVRVSSSDRFLSRRHIELNLWSLGAFKSSENPHFLEVRLNLHQYISELMVPVWWLIMCQSCGESVASCDINTPLSFTRI